MRCPIGLSHFSRVGVGTYFGPWTTLGLYLCFMGRIHVKYANSKLAMKPFADWMLPGGLMCTLFWARGPPK